MRTVQRPCSSVDRALASEARSGSSSLPRDAILFKVISLFLLCSLLFSACIPHPPASLPPWQDWHLDDLLWLNQSSTDTRSPQLIAAYFRSASSSCQVRFDFLDLDPGALFTLEVNLFIQNHRLDHSSPDYKVLITPDESVKFFQVNQASQSLPPPQVFRNTDLDSMVVQFNRQVICLKVGLLFSARILTESQPIDSTPLISIDSPNPRPARLLLTFWDTLPGATPIQLLRHWEGAHAGPYGQRHGLKILLDEVARFKIPVFLLDLQNESSLAGLDFINQMDLLKSLVSRNLVTLASYAAGDPIALQQSLRLSQQSGEIYNLHSSGIAFSPAAPVIGYSRDSFWFTTNPASIQSFMATRILPLPYPPLSSPPQWISEAVSPQGLSTYVKLLLLHSSGSINGSEILTLGGSLPASPWADTTVASIAMEYIATHPWIQPIWPADLPSFPVTAVNLGGVAHSTEQLTSRLYIDLLNAPHNELSQSALEMFLQLSQPTSDPQVRGLQKAYLPKVRQLLLAGHWAENPYSAQKCDADLDEDGSLECVLSNDSVFLILSPIGGRIELAAACEQSHCMQWLGSTAQFSIGLSDPGTWNLTDPVAPDPDVLPGALVDSNNPSKVYTVQFSPEEIRFLSPGSEIQKSIHISTDGFSVEINSSQPSTYFFPILLSSAFGNTQSWSDGFLLHKEKSTILWGLPPDELVSMNIFDASSQFASFKTIQAIMQEPENPDFSYEPIFFKPFPLALLIVGPSTHWRVDFSIR